MSAILGIRERLVEKRKAEREQAVREEMDRFFAETPLPPVAPSSLAIHAAAMLAPPVVSLGEGCRRLPPLPKKPQAPNRPAEPFTGPLSTFGQELARMRHRAGLSMAKLGKLAACDYAHIARLERGERMPSRGMVDRLADALNVEPGDRARLLRAAGFASADEPPLTDPRLRTIGAALADPGLDDRTREVLDALVRVSVVFIERRVG